jgi:hypothetical protein
MQKPKRGDVVWPRQIPINPINGTQQITRAEPLMVRERYWVDGATCVLRIQDPFGEYRLRDFVFYE